MEILMLSTAIPDNVAHSVRGVCVLFVCVEDLLSKSRDGVLHEVSVFCVSVYTIQ